MQDIMLKESKTHGDVAFPFAFYHVNERHPRYEMNMHWHEECEIVRVLKGKLTITIDGHTYEGMGKNGKSDIFFINSGALHCAHPQDCTYECVVFDLHFLLRERSLSNSFIYSLLYNQRRFLPFLPIASEREQKKGDPIVDHALEVMRGLEEETVISLNKLFDTLRDRDTGFELKTYGILYYLLGLMECGNLFANAEGAGEAISRIMKMRMALSYIHRNYKEAISLNELSDLLDLRPPSVVKLFRDIINKKPMEYINSYRIECAKELLKNESNNVTDVAYECGFSDVSYFTKVFKKYAGTTPRAYVKEIKRALESKITT